MKSNTNDQLDSELDATISLSRDTLDMRIITLERLVADMIDSIEKIKSNDSSSDNNKPFSSREISRELDSIHQDQTLAAESNQQTMNRIENIEQKIVDSLENFIAIKNRTDELEIQLDKFNFQDFIALKNRANEMEIRLDKFYDSLNFLNRYQHQLDGITSRIDEMERSLGSLENTLNVNIASRFDTLSSEGQRIHSLVTDRSHSIETRLSSIEHTVLNFVSPRRFISAVKRNILRRFGKSV